MKKFITVLLGAVLALGTVSLSLVGGGEQQEQGGVQTQEGAKAGKKGGGKGKRGKGKRGKGRRNRDGAAQTPSAPAIPQP